MAALANPELQDLERQIDALEIQVDSLVQGLGDEAANWRPGANRWSVVQCLEHLNAACRLYFPDLDAAVERARRKGLTGPQAPRRGWLGRRMIRMIDAPVRRKMPAPKPFIPADTLSLAAVVAQYRADKKRLRQILLAADGLDLWRAKMRMSAFKLIKLSLGDTLAFMLAHERRHLWQAERIRATPGYPAASAASVAAE